MKYWIVPLYASMSFLLGACSSCRILELAQTNEDGVKGSFDAKVVTSSLPGVAAGARCTGEIMRQRGSPDAEVTMRCGERLVYSGRGVFKLDVHDPKTRDDDTMSYDDAKTTDGDGSPALKFDSTNHKPDGTNGAMILWDVARGDAAGYRVVLVL